MPSSSQTETSPLLLKANRTEPELIDPSSGVLATSAPAADRLDESANADGAASESQQDNGGQQNPFEGLSEVRKQMIYVFPALALGVFLCACDQTIIASSYGKIGSELNALNKTSWIATSYFLSLSSFQPLYGKLSDIFSRKSCIMSSYFIFGLGCLFCGLARNIDELIAARAFAGIGGGGMTTVVSIILSDAITLKERGKWQGYVNIVYAAGASSGAPLGGILADTIGWRWAFLGQVPICALCMAATGIALHMPKREQTHWRDKLRRIDFSGAFVLICAIFALLLGLDRGGNVSWHDKTAWVPLCLSVPLFACFTFVERKIAREPLAPGHLIFSRSLFASYLCNFFSFCGCWATLFFIPLFLQAVDGFTATQAGLLLIPSLVAGVSGSLFAGYYMQWSGKYYWLTVTTYFNVLIGGTLILVCSGLGHNATWGIVVGSCIAGFSNGIGVTSTLIALISNASKEDQAVVTACSYLFRSLGATIGLSLSATVANQTLRRLLNDQLKSGKDAEEIAERVRLSLEYIRTLDPDVRAIVRHCYMLSTQIDFGLQLGLATGAAIAAWFIIEQPLNR